jgi:hypothetical protein
MEQQFTRPLTEFANIYLPVREISSQLLKLQGKHKMAIYVRFHSSPVMYLGKHEIIWRSSLYSLVVIG